MSQGVRRMATVTASTKRRPSMVSGKQGEPAVNVASLKCTPLDPADRELAARLGLGTPHELLQTFVDNGVDVREGDYLTVGTVDFPVRYVGDWVWRGTTFRHLLVEQLKQ